MADGQDASNLIVPRFYIHTLQNEAKSKAAGRPIFDEMEVCEIRMAANKQTVGVFPAHEIWRTEKDLATGEVAPITYAMRFPDQYKKFKAGEAQVQSGTPLSELLFLSASKRLELKALNIHTAEALAALDGQPLKLLGMGGRELKNAAQAYLDKAAGTANVTGMAATIASQEVQLAEMRQQMAEMQVAMRERGSSLKGTAPAPLDVNEWPDGELRAFLVKRDIKPRANASHENLVAAVQDVQAQEAEPVV